MDALTAHDHFTTWTPEQRAEGLPGFYCVNTPAGPVDAWPAFAAAAVSLAGWLPTMETAELGDALRHFRVMFEAGVFTWDAWEDEVRGILMDLMEWGDRQDAIAGDRPPLPEFSRN